MKNALKFFFQSDVQKIFEHFTEITGIRIAFLSPDGQEMIVGSNRSLCTYCNMLRKKFNFDQTCCKLDLLMRQQATTSKVMVAYTCHGGMNEAIFPIYSYGNLLGFIMIGQFRTPELRHPKLDRHSKKELKQLQIAYASVPCFEKSQLPHILGLFGNLIELIMSHSMIHAAENPLLPLLNYMAENVETSISLEDAARVSHRSKSSVQHLFKTHTGKSFNMTALKLLKKSVEVCR